MSGSDANEAGQRFQAGNAVLWLIGVPAVLLVLWLGVVTWQQVRDTKHRTACHSHLGRLGLALHSYHDDYGSFPPAFVRGPDGERWHSWRVLLLPYLGQQELYDAYRFDQPWNSEANRSLAAQAPEAYQCPACSSEADRTNYFAIVSRRSMWPAYQTVSLADVRDGGPNTLQLVEDPRNDVVWTAPVDVSPVEVMEGLPVDAPHGGKPMGGRFFQFVDGSTRFLSGTIDRSIVASLITPHYGHATFTGSDWPADLSPQLEDPLFGPPQDVSQLAGTTIVAALDDPLLVDESTLWCATFQMAWDRLKQKTSGGHIELSDNVPAADRLNAATFPTSALSEDCYALLVGGVDAAETREMIRRLRDRFPDADPNIEADLRGYEGIRFYAYLKKSMPFASEFERLDQGMTFRTNADESHRVAGFGLPAGESAGPGEPVRESEVAILDYVNDQSFIVQLNTDGPQSDRIVLALVLPADTLRGCWDDVQQRIEAPHPQHDRPHLTSADSLQIPLLTCNLQTDFSDLLDQEIVNLPSLPEPVFIRLVRQAIRLKLDERGADFVSAAELVVVGENGHIHAAPGQPRRFHFDRPFLLALWESDDQEPYFLAWIAGTGLMEPVGTE